MARRSKASLLSRPSNEQNFVEQFSPDFGTEEECPVSIQAVLIPFPESAGVSIANHSRVSDWDTS